MAHGERCDEVHREITLEVVPPDLGQVQNCAHDSGEHGPAGSTEHAVAERTSDVELDSSFK